MPNHTPPQIFLVDGYALIYRAFFAMMSRPLRTTRGENTSAAWGVVNFLLRLQEKYRPDYLTWVLDAGTSFRAERYPDYKSTREKLGDELQADFDRAVERTRQLLEAFRVTCSEVPGFEADDVIGTLATKAAAGGLQAVIVSGDKDFYQLIGPRVALLNPGRGGPGGVDRSRKRDSGPVERAAPRRTASDAGHGVQPAELERGVKLRLPVRVGSPGPPAALSWTRSGVRPGTCPDRARDHSTCDSAASLVGAGRSRLRFVRRFAVA